MTADRVSVVIPVLNNAGTIAEAIQSALGQTRPPLEVIVVDDGSTDGSGDVAAAPGATVRVLRQETQGIGAARNAGIRAADGEVIALLDADDRWLPHKLEQQLAALAPGVDVVFGWVAPVLESDWARVVREGVPRTSWMPGPLPSAVLMRRSAFDRVGLFHDYRAGEFIDWFARARDAGLGIARVDELVTLRRIHAENHGVRNKEAYAEGYLAVARATLERAAAARSIQPREPDVAGEGKPA